MYNFTISDIVAGFDNTSVHAYNFTTGKWSSLRSLFESRYNHASAIYSRSTSPPSSSSPSLTQELWVVGGLRGSERERRNAIYMDARSREVHSIFFFFFSFSLFFLILFIYLFLFIYYFCSGNPYTLIKIIKL